MTIQKNWTYWWDRFVRDMLALRASSYLYYCCNFGNTLTESCRIVNSARKPPYDSIHVQVVNTVHPICHELFNIFPTVRQTKAIVLSDPLNIFHQLIRWFFIRFNVHLKKLFFKASSEIIMYFLYRNIIFYSKQCFIRKIKISLAVKFQDRVQEVGGSNPSRTTTWNFKKQKRIWIWLIWSFLLEIIESCKMLVVWLISKK